MRCILVLTTRPLRIRPLMETSPVNGHLLSMYFPSIASLGVLNPSPTFLYHLFPAFPGTFPPLRTFLRYLQNKSKMSKSSHHSAKYQHNLRLTFPFQKQIEYPPSFRQDFGWLLSRRQMQHKQGHWRHRSTSRHFSSTTRS